jgi:hypothetical protein
MIIVKVLGGLGNQMFQYAFYKSLKSSEDKLLDIRDFNDYKLHNGFELDKIFELKSINYAEVKDIEKLFDCKRDIFSRIKRKIMGRKRTHIIEPYLHFDEKYLNMKNVYLDGYWQSEKYFKKSEKIIRKEFIFSRIIEEQNIEILKEIEKTNSISIHIRRGDYLNHTLYSDICSIEYYERAINYIKTNVENPVFFIFSNDIDWCKESFYFEESYFIDWNLGEKSFRDMQLMSSCKNNIIANSSFSWWGAWLNENPNKIIIAPNKWVNDGRVNIDDIVPEGWIRL